MLTGLSSFVNGLAGGRNWSITPTAEVNEYADTGTSGAKAAVDGIVDWSGSFSAYGYLPLVMPGDDFTFTGSIDGTNGATGSAICDSIEISWNQEKMAPIECVVNFSSDGPLTLGAATGSAGATATPPIASQYCIVNNGSSINVRTVKMTLSCENQEYADTATAGVKKREKGVLSGSVSWSRYCDTFASLGAANSVVTVKLYVTQTLYWELAYCKYTGSGDITLDRESGALVGATENLIFTAVNGSSTLGHINKPGGSAWWPW